jgi:ferredoxin/flavodoxin---NADP+ reductase
VISESLRKKRRLPTAAIVKRLDFTPDHFKLWLKPAEPFAFRPGQYCTIGVDGIERPYSIVSSPREELLELFVERIPPPVGRLTPLLHQLEVGDSVTMRPRAKGVFVLKPEFRNHVMVATVTGVAPFVSMIRHWAEQPAEYPRFFVLEGASFVDEFGYDEELQRLAAKHVNIEFVSTCSRPQDPRNAAWAGETGRVNAIVERYVRQWGLQPPETCIYACGHPLMIEDLRARYADTGFGFEEERFWNDRTSKRPRKAGRTHDGAP